MATTTKVFNMAGGKHSAEAYSSFEGLLYGSCVANGFTITKSSSNMNCFINSGAGLIMVGSTYARRVAIEGGTLTATVSAASATLARRDTIVLYVDNSVTPTTSVEDNTNNILKSMVVAGTPAQSPSAPNATTIQSAVGAGNPYIILYDILVPANATNLSTATLYDRRVMASAKIISDAANNSIPGSKLQDASVSFAKLNHSEYDEITAKLASDATNVGAGVTLQLTSILAQQGTKLSTNSGGIKIGAGISKVEVSGSVFFNSSAQNYGWVSFQKNGTEVTEFIADINGGSYGTAAMTPLLLSVSQNDVLTFVNKEAGRNIRGTSTYMTVKVVG